MSCHCRELRIQLAQHVGQDEVSLPEELRRRVSVCPECRHYFKQLKTSVRLLRDYEGDDQTQLEKSLWPELVRRMPAKRPSRRWSDRASLAFSASAITVATLALFVVPLTGPGSPAYMTSPASFPAQTISAPAQPVDLQNRAVTPMNGTPLKLFERLLEKETKKQEKRDSGKMLFGPAYEQ